MLKTAIQTQQTEYKGFLPYKAKSLNWIIADNNPIVFRDLDGHFSCSCGGGGSGGGGSLGCSCTFTNSGGGSSHVAPPSSYAPSISSHGGGAGMSSYGSSRSTLGSLSYYSTGPPTLSQQYSHTNWSSRGVPLGGELINAGVDFIPFIGDAKGIYESWTGYDAFGRELSLLERGLGFIFLSELKVLGKGNKLKGVIFHKHHTIPIEVQKLLPEHVRSHPDIIGRKGLPNRTPVEANRHLGELHEGAGGGLYNDDFKSRLLDLRGSYERVRVRDVLQVRDELVNKYDIR